MEKEYPHWVMTIAFGMICAGILPMPLVYLLRRFQVLKVDLDIHQGSIRRNETTASTKEMIDQDDDVSSFPHATLTFISICVFFCPSLSLSLVGILNLIFRAQFLNFAMLHVIYFSWKEVSASFYESERESFPFPPLPSHHHHPILLNK